MIRALLISLALVVPAIQAAEPLKVGVVDAPPFSMQGKDGAWTGVAIDLWKQAAGDLDIEWTMHPGASHAAVVDELAAGRIDVAVGGFTVTPDRAARVEFLAAWESTSTGVAMQQEEGLHIGTLLASLADDAFISLLLMMVLMVLLFGIAIWLCERHRNDREFGGGHHHGLGSGLWWSMVTMSTVGYGDKSPRTWPGRIVAGVWIMMGLVLVSVFTGAAATAFTKRSVKTTSHVSDLGTMKVGVLEGGETQAWLKQQGVSTIAVQSTAEGLRQVADGTFGAFVGDTPVLRWSLVHENISGLEVRSGLRPERLSFAVRPGLKLERDLNVALLKAMRSPEWQVLLKSWGWPREGVLR